MDTVKSALCSVFWDSLRTCFVMKRMNVLILAVTILAKSCQLSGRHRGLWYGWQNNRAENDHARQCMWYLRGEAWSPVSAKDIRILHMKEWLLKR